MYTQSTSIILAAVLSVLWTTLKAKGMIAPYAAGYGFFSGALLGLVGACAAVLTTDKRRLGARMGILFAAIGVTSLAGNLTAAALEKRFGFTGAWVWSAASGISGGAIMWIGMTLADGSKEVSLENMS